MVKSVGQKIQLTTEFSVEKKEYEILRMVAEGYKLPYICSHLKKTYPEITARATESFLKRTAENQFGFNNETWGTKKYKFSLHVKIANWFNELMSGDRSRVQYFDLLSKTRFLRDGTQVRYAERAFKAKEKIESIAYNYLRKLGRGPYEEFPKIQVEAENLNDRSIDHKVYFEPGQLSANVATGKYIFARPLECNDHILMKTKQCAKDWYARTQVENALQWKNTPEHNVSYSTKKSRGFQTLWADYSFRQQIELNVEFSEEYPAQHPRLRLYSYAWDREIGMEEALLKVGCFKINGKSYKSVGDSPVRKMQFKAYGLPSIKIAFFWKPFVLE